MGRHARDLLSNVKKPACQGRSWLTRDKVPNRISRPFGTEIGFVLPNRVFARDGCVINIYTQFSSFASKETWRHAIIRCGAMTKAMSCMALQTRNPQKHLRQSSTTCRSALRSTGAAALGAVEEAGLIDMPAFSEQSRKRISIAFLSEPSAVPAQRSLGSRLDAENFGPASFWSARPCGPVISRPRVDFPPPTTLRLHRPLASDHLRWTRQPLSVQAFNYQLLPEMGIPAAGVQNRGRRRIDR